MHLLGLRGGALDKGGDDVRGGELLSQASGQAPSIWSDGRLSAGELR